MLRSGPQLADQFITTRADEAAEDEGDDDGIVELTRDGNEVRDEIEGKREVASERDEQKASAAVGRGSRALGGCREQCSPG